MNEETDTPLDEVTSVSNNNDDVLAQLERLKKELEQRKMLDLLTAIARKEKVPKEIIEHDLHMFLDHFALQDGQLVSATEPEKPASAVLQEMQKKRPHWNIPTVVAGCETIKSISMSTARNFAEEVERQTRTWFD